MSATGFLTGLLPGSIFPEANSFLVTFLGRNNRPREGKAGEGRRDRNGRELPTCLDMQNRCIEEPRCCFAVLEIGKGDVRLKVLIVWSVLTAPFHGFMR